MTAVLNETVPTQTAFTGFKGPQAASRWFGVGRSTDSDVRVAGADATREALAGRSASLVVVYCPADIDFRAMLDGVRSAAGDVPLIGCSGLAQLAQSGAADPAVVVSALGGNGFEVRTSVALNVSGGQRAAGEHVADIVSGLTSEHKFLMLLADGLAGDQHELVRGAYNVVGATVGLAGGCAADDFLYEQTFQFIGDATGVQVLSNAVVAAAIGSNAPIGVGVAHGWRKVGEPMVATRSAGGIVYTLDGEPALDVFAKRVGAPRSIAEDSEAFIVFAMKHPLGMSRRSGEDIRVIHGGNAKDGSIECLADVPQGALLWMMETDRAGLVSCVDDAYAEAVAQLDDVPPLGFMVFDCGVRYLFLEPEGVREEVARFTDRTAGIPFAGFYTMGEIARTRGARGMHHLTLVLVAFA
ncbi:MAG TPA: FIST N-terminal domain-containing protein [Acidothermaceae bacterium]